MCLSGGKTIEGNLPVCSGYYSDEEGMCVAGLEIPPGDASLPGPSEPEGAFPFPIPGGASDGTEPVEVEGARDGFKLEIPHGNASLPEQKPVSKGDNSKPTIKIPGGDEDYPGHKVDYPPNSKPIYANKPLMSDAARRSVVLTAAVFVLGCMYYILAGPQTATTNGLMGPVLGDPNDPMNYVI